MRMREVELTGPDGRLEGRYQEGGGGSAPLALVLHPHPMAGGEMSNPVVAGLARTFAARGFSVLCFNFRGVGGSEGAFDGGPGELADAAAALAWLRAAGTAASECWIAGYSFGAWIGLQLVKQASGIAGFVAVSPPPNHFDFSFLAPCPAPGLIVQGGRDAIAPAAEVERLVAELGAVVEYVRVEAADHFWMNDLAEVERRTGDYVDRRLGKRSL
jgi:alpha/beta superfamily hydrolase